MLKRLEQGSPYLSEQMRLLKKADRSEMPLAEVLASAGWSYDDLIYENSRAHIWRGKPGPTLKEMATRSRSASMVSFFTGCGGMDLGLEAVGYRHMAAFEINELFCKTLRYNRPKWKVFGPPTHSGDVSKFDEIAGALNGLIKAPFDGIFVGGPPASLFPSLQTNDSRNGATTSSGWDLLTPSTAICCLILSS